MPHPIDPQRLRRDESTDHDLGVRNRRLISDDLAMVLENSGENEPLRPVSLIVGPKRREVLELEVLIKGAA